MIRSQIRYATRQDVLIQQFIEYHSMTASQFIQAINALYALGVEDEPCPFHPTIGWDWAHQLPI
jgi:hypothetical protein